MKDTTTFERDKTTWQHSALVARAAAKIARFLPELNAETAFQCGLFHDVGKLYLPREDFYKHPFLGYTLMRDANEPLLAEVCLLHSFPLSLASGAYFSHYCRGDAAEVARVKAAMETLNLSPAMQDYVALIQLCDKISGVTEYVTLEGKAAWYKARHKLDEESLRKNIDALQNIKKRLERRIQKNIYALLGLPKD